MEDQPGPVPPESNPAPSLTVHVPPPSRRLRDQWRYAMAKAKSKSAEADDLKTQLADQSRAASSLEKQLGQSWANEKKLKRTIGELRDEAAISKRAHKIKQDNHNSELDQAVRQARILERHHYSQENCELRSQLKSSEEERVEIPTVQIGSGRP